MDNLMALYNLRGKPAICEKENWLF